MTGSARSRIGRRWIGAGVGAWIALLGCVEKGDTKVKAQQTDGEPTCVRFCDRVREEGCAARLCQGECQFVEGCQESIEALFACAADAPLVCDADGQPRFGGCDAQYKAASACISNPGDDASCEAKTSHDECFECCSDAHPTPLDRKLAYFFDCVCKPGACGGTGGACAEFCAANTDETYTDACHSCADGVSSQCNESSNKVCEQDPACKPFRDCASRCVGKP